MHPYRVKEYMWLLIVVVMVVIGLSGCSSAPVTTAKNPHDQYCYTKQTIEVVDGKNVSSKTVVDCNDNKVERVAIKQAGLATNCGRVTYDIPLGGKNVKSIGISCYKPDGNIEYISD